MTTAILLGATGEVGGAILQELLASPAYRLSTSLGVLPSIVCPIIQR
ncbi:hypothetical protein [Streptococcus oralis]|nr:hypothetical protein [Streptococcus oralis]